MSKRNFSAEDGLRPAKKPKADSEALLEGIRVHLLGALRYLQQVSTKKIFDFCAFLKAGVDPDCLTPEELLTKVSCLFWVWDVLDERLAKQLPDVVSSYISKYWLKDMEDTEMVTAAHSLPYMPTYNEAAKRWGKSSTMDALVEEEKAHLTTVLVKLRDLYRKTCDDSYEAKAKDVETKLSSLDNIGNLCNPCLINLAERRLKQMQKTLNMEGTALWLVIPHFPKNLLLPAKKNAKQDEEKEEGTKGPRRRTPEELKKLFASRRKRQEETRKMHEETFQKLPEEKKAIVSAVREVVGKEAVFFSDSFVGYCRYLCTIQESETTHLKTYGEGSSELRNVLEQNNATIRWESDGFFVIANVYLLDDKPKKKPK